MTNQLSDFIAQARQKNVDHATIRMVLMSAGWKEKDVAKALIAEELDIPVPLPPDVGGAREAFFHLLAFAGLYTSFVSLIILYFTYIERLFPDAALDPTYIYNDNLSGMRWSMAAVIVAFPLYLWITRLLVKDMESHPERSVSGIRRWLTYLTLFLAAGAILGDLITLIFYLLEGELSIRFLLKVLVVLVMAGMVFTYYFLSLRNEPDHPMMKKMHRSFFFAGTLVAVVALAWGAFLIGSPMSERDRKFDDKRVEDMRAISSEIRNIVYEGMQPAPSDSITPKQPVPENLAEVVAKAYYQKVNITDPETGNPYVYEKVTNTRYNLCAVFSFDRQEQYDIFWNHPAGQHCYEIDVTEQPRY